MIKKHYNIGEIVWICMGSSNTKSSLTKGTIISAIDLSAAGYSDDIMHYIVSVATAIEPVLEIRTWHTMSQDRNGPVGGLRGKDNRTPSVAMKKESIQLYSQSDYELGDPTPDQIHAAQEKYRKSITHSPFVFTDTKQKLNKSQVDRRKK